MTLSQKTFGPHGMSLYMLLIALYSSVHTPTNTGVTQMYYKMSEI